MRRFLYLLLPLIGLTSCEDFLTREPLVETTEANFYRNEADAIAAVNAAYDALQFEATPDFHFRWMFGDVVSDDAIKGGSGPNDIPELGRLENFRGTAANALVESEWAENYRGIYRANLVLVNVPNIEMDEVKKAQILGEASFIRAYFYYYLNIMFGGVPMVTEPLAPEEYNLARSTPEEIWGLIESDLTSAIASLPTRSEYPLSDQGRITKGAAQALYVKALLWQERFAEAESVANDIITSGEYMLEPVYASIWTLQGENGPGSVFEIQYMSESNGDWGRFQEGTLTNVFQRARGQYNGYGFNIPTQDLVDAYENGDPRLDATIFMEGDIMGDRGVFSIGATGQPHPYYARKYFLNQADEASTGDTQVNGPSNDRVIRYADVLLMHAEAAAMNGNAAGALASLNAVRARARGNNANILPDVQTTNTDDLMAAIRQERRVELALEGHRFFDLVRWGIADQELDAVIDYHGDPVDETNYDPSIHSLFPIPQSQIDATNGAITQNPGY